MTIELNAAELALVLKALDNYAEKLEDLACDAEDDEDDALIAHERARFGRKAARLFKKSEDVTDLSERFQELKKS